MRPSGAPEPLSPNTCTRPRQRLGLEDVVLIVDADPVSGNPASYVQPPGHGRAAPEEAGPQTAVGQRLRTAHYGRSLSPPLRQGGVSIKQTSRNATLRRPGDLVQIAVSEAMVSSRTRIVDARRNSRKSGSTRRHSSGLPAEGCRGANLFRRATLDPVPAWMRA